jgi:type I restriction enzyme S subunit
MPEWRKVSLGQLARWLSGGTPKTSVAAYWGGHIPWISAASLRSFNIESSDRKITSLGAENGTRIVPLGTTIFVVRGMSLMSEFRIGITATEVAFGQDCKALIPHEGVDPYFLAYSIRARAPDILELVESAGHGTGRLPTDRISNMAVSIPQTVDGQVSIVRVLRVLDDKIAINERIVKLIFELVQHLWEQAARRAKNFVPVAGIADVNKGLSYKGAGLGSGTPLINLGNFSTEGRFKASGLKHYAGDAQDRHRIEPGELVVANTGLTQRREILGQPILVPRYMEKALFTHHVFAIRTKVGTPPNDVLWLYGAFRDRNFRDRAITYATGTTVLALPRDAILAYELRWPSEGIRNGWGRKARIMLDLAEDYISETKTLAELRDMLLPGLMSGEIRVQDAEQAVEEAT